jgi:hypothetical protein
MGISCVKVSGAGLIPTPIRRLPQDIKPKQTVQDFDNV